METTSEWGNLCTRLLLAPLFREENPEHFSNLLAWQERINEYFSVIGLKLVISESDGYAFLAENEDEEGNLIGDGLRLLRRFPLTYEQSLLLVLLREELDKFEMSKSNSRALVMHESQIAELLEPYYPNHADKVKFEDMVSSLLSSLAQMEFVKCIHRPSTGNLTTDGEREYEIRTIVRAKITLPFLTEFKERLEKAKEQADA
jgi:hypothetical protein